MLKNVSSFISSTFNPSKFFNLSSGTILFLESTVCSCKLLDFIHDPNKYILLDNHKYLKNDYKIYVIGGQQIYNLLYKYCSTIWLTKIKANYECDLFFSKEILDSFNTSVVEYENDELEINKLKI